MSRLLRMDRSGHTELAAWSAGDSRSPRPRRNDLRRAARRRVHGRREAARPVLRAGEAAAGGRRVRAAAPPDRGRVVSAALPELEAVAWRRRTDERSLRLRERISAAYTTLYVTPLVLVAAGLLLARAAPVPGVCAGARARLGDPGAVREPRRGRGAGAAAGARRTGPSRWRRGCSATCSATSERELQRRTGLALERGRLGVWLVGDAGALLVRPGGRRVHTFCVRVADAELPRSDRVAHLLLALREDEQGFATVANHAFAGRHVAHRRRAGWRPRPARPALDAAVAAAAERLLARPRRVRAGRSAPRPHAAPSTHRLS